MLKLTLIFTIMLTVLTGCVAQRVKTTPFKQVKIPPLSANKSRIYFHHAGSDGSARDAQIKNAKNEEVISILRWFQCTHIDVEPGDYLLRAEHRSIAGNELTTKISTQAGKTYYMIWWWNRDRKVGYFGSERGAHFMNLHPDQGKKMISNCHYRPTSLKPGVLN